MLMQRVAGLCVGLGLGLSSWIFAPVAAKVIINELMINDNQTNAQWIELFNTDGVKAIGTSNVILVFSADGVQDESEFTVNWTKTKADPAYMVVGNAAAGRIFTDDTMVNFRLVPNFPTFPKDGTIGLNGNGDFNFATAFSADNSELDDFFAWNNAIMDSPDLFGHPFQDGASLARTDPNSDGSLTASWVASTTMFPCTMMRTTAAGGTTLPSFKATPNQVNNASCPIAAPPPTVTGLTLINANTDQAIRVLTNGTSFRRRNPDYNINATVTGMVERIDFFRRGSAGRLATEDKAPFAICGNRNADFFRCASRFLACGTGTNHSITAIPYDTNGVAGVSHTVSFTVTC